MELLVVFLLIALILFVLHPLRFISSVLWFLLRLFLFVVIVATIVKVL